MQTPFHANPGATLRVTAATAAGSAPRLLGMPEGGGCQVRVRNRGSVDAAIEFGKSDVTATVSVAGTVGSLGIAPGTVETFTLQQNQRHVAVAVASGTPDLEFTTGEGL